MKGTGHHEAVPAGDVVGVLLLRVWREEHAESSLRIRLVGCPDVELGTCETTAAASVDEAVQLVRDWLDRFPPLPAGQDSDAP